MTSIMMNGDESSHLRLFMSIPPSPGVTTKKASSGDQVSCKQQDHHEGGGCADHEGCHRCNHNEPGG